MLSRMSGVNATQTVRNEQSVKVDAKPLKQEYAASLKSVSSEQLLQAMGGKPKPDFKLFGLIPIHRSTEYKQVINKLDEFRNQFAEIADKGIGKFDMPSMTRLQQSLRDAYDAASSYQKAHAGDGNKADRRDVMEQLKSALGQEMKTLDALLKTAGSFKDGTTIGDAMVILKSGVKTTSIVENPHKNQTVLDSRTFGAGNVNTVTLATFENRDKSVEQRVLKPLTKEVEYFHDAEAYAGFDVKNSKMGERNIAQSMVAAMLGVPGMIPKPSIIVFGDQVCLDMPLAQGEPAQSNVTVPCTQHHLKTINDLTNRIAISTDEKEQGRLKSDLKGFMQINGISVNENGEYMEKANLQLDLPYSSTEPNELTANLQKALMDMQVVDVLCGQVDRNMGNYFIKVNGTEVELTGIDNDACFGENEKCGINTLDPNERDGFLWTGMPPVMTRKMADTLVSIDAEGLRHTLSAAGLEKPEIDLAVIRLGKMQEHVKTLESKGLVTDDFIGFKTKAPDSDKELTMSDFLLSKPNGHSNYVHKAAGIQQQSKLEGYTLPQPDPEKHQIAGR